MALFQFVVYPLLVRTVGIICLLRSSGVFCAMLFLALPDAQRLNWSEKSSYVVGVVIVVLVLSCISVVRAFLQRCGA